MNKGIFNKIVKAIGGFGIAGLVVSTIAISVKWRWQPDGNLCIFLGNAPYPS